MSRLLAPFIVLFLVGCGAPNIGVAQNDSHFLHNFNSDVTIATKNRTPTTQESHTLYVESIQAENFLNDYDAKFGWYTGFYATWHDAWFGPRGHAAFWTLVAVASGLYILYLVAAGLSASSGTGVMFTVAKFVKSGLGTLWSLGAKDVGNLVAKKVAAPSPVPDPATTLMGGG